MRRHLPPTAAAALALALACGAAAPPAAAAPDPLEGVNRRVHAFNRLAQAHVLGPAAELYRAHASPGFRRGLGNLLATLREPVTALSGLAAGEVDLARTAATRFAINATLGRGGVRDRAAELGHPPRPFTPADALCAWGVPSGPFLVLPLLGPSTLRDAGAMAAAGAALSQAIGPDAWLAWSTTEALHGYAELHPELERVEATSLDPYAVLRSAYLQRRAAACAVDRAAAAAAAAAEGDGGEESQQRP
jgi:phospholipid-binding lipoprotein MlaA